MYTSIFCFNSAIHFSIEFNIGINCLNIFEIPLIYSTRKNRYINNNNCNSGVAIFLRFLNEGTKEILCFVSMIIAIYINILGVLTLIAVSSQYSGRQVDGMYSKLYTMH